MTERKIKTINHLAIEISKDPKLQKSFKDDPVAAAQALASHPMDSDRALYRIAISALSLVSVGAVIGYILLPILGTEIPQALVALGSAAIGALGAIFKLPESSNE